MERFCSINRYTSLYAAMLAALLSGCASPGHVARSPDNAPVSTAPTLSAAIDSHVYRQELGDSRVGPLQRIHRNDGYTVESGGLLSREGETTGSLVAVRAPTGAVTAVVDRPGRRGLLLVDAQGKRRFLPEPAYDYLKADTLAGMPSVDLPTAPGSADAGGVVDALVAFSTLALDTLDSDPVAFALAQLETVNVGLRNSDVRNVRVDLAGILITAKDRSVDSAGLREIQTLMEPLRAAYRHDINVAYSKDSPYAGMAYVPGLSSINGIEYPMAFRHELGHNVGGSHCHPDGGNHYKHGYQAESRRATHLCGNNLPFYSNPDISFEGRPMGNAQTADMARLWREQAGRLANAGPAFEGERMIVLSFQPEQSLWVITTPNSSSAGVVALSPNVGPVALTSGAGTETMLRVPLRAEDGQTYTVNLRAQKQSGTCARTGMNSSMGCNPQYDAGAFSLFLNYDVEQNLHLPEGWYNGTLELKAIDSQYPQWSKPILVSLSVRR